MNYIGIVISIMSFSYKPVYKWELKEEKTGVLLK